MRRIAIMVSLLAAVAGYFPCLVLGADDAIYACYKKQNGQLRVVANRECGPDEVAISWNKTSPSIQDNSQSGIKVYDAAGKYLGTFVNDEIGGIRIYVPSLYRTILIDKTKGDTDDGVLLFSEAKCGGTAYITAGLQYEIIKVWGKYYTSKESSPPVNQSFGSQAYGATSCLSYGYPEYMVPAVEVALPFGLPVVLPFRFED